MKEVIQVYTKAFDFDGRSSVREFVYYSVFLLTILGGLVYLVFDSATQLPEQVVELFILLNVLPNLALTVRRLHDLDKSGWWILISLVPVAGPLTLWLMIFFPGSQGANRHGAAPSRLHKANDS
ncbi:DUF805 domain-containing protein [Pseudomonas sp. LJDD11]|uniref:DUF805 domain-containing protein n=1 Tax=Pseudomonas sp. LJDD11 TaxID=2931984 RepID=UPI00211C71D9|nr:DUF805 domain-containing protein [Pseudomonas sp. LJDD11]MCQ9426483.1 DUF805 domain-containing protein [Pseudomonas sp. LJDD11]